MKKSAVLASALLLAPLPVMADDLEGNDLTKIVSSVWMVKFPTLV